ncbi:MAG: hypothetical protein VKM17_00195 [Cyanobacteriota bacterium]|nr:hypothetical protein [Cyanobacteriota bacterium]
MPPSPRKRSQLALQLPEDLIRRLRDLAQARGCTVSHLAMDAFSKALGEAEQDDLAQRVSTLESRVAALEGVAFPANDPSTSTTASAPPWAPTPAPCSTPTPTSTPPAAEPAPDLPAIGARLTSSAIARATGTNPSGWSAWAASHASGSIRRCAGGSFRLVVRSDRGRRRVSWERLT